ncbi:MAG TPA: histidine phosphatase family protein [Gaiellales bacterium]|nr:histidine phosphatase family protein [Gaiellales bacterium]
MRERLMLMRHGETVWNAEHRFTTRTDVELSAAGLEQAAEAARALSAVGIDRVFASPLSRARRTAELIAAAQAADCPVLVDERLTEIDAGPFEGMTSAEIAAGDLAEAYHGWHALGTEFPPGTERFDDALARASAFLADHAGLPGSTLVVTHGSLARLIVCSHFLGGAPRNHRRLWLDNCRLALFQERDGEQKMMGFNILAP